MNQFAQSVVTFTPDCATAGLSGRVFATGDLKSTAGQAGRGTGVWSLVIRGAIAVTLLLVGIIFVPTVIAQEINPSQVLIVGNGQNADSMRLARLYARGRNIPSRNILMLNLPDREDVSRQQYNTEIAYPIRQFLQQMKRENDIKILVTMYGLPLKVGASSPTLGEQAKAKRVEEQFHATFIDLEAAYRELELMAGTATSRPTALPGGQNMDKFFPDLIQITEKVRGLYRRIVPKMQAMKDRSEQQSALNTFVRLRLLIEGQLAMVPAAQEQPQANAEVLQRLKGMEREFLELLKTPPENRDLDNTCQAARKLGGLYLELKTLHEDYGRLRQKDSLAAVDSELCLVLWHEYVLAGRLPNALNPRFANSPMVAGQGPTLMVCRLDGPSPAVVERIIRDSLATEKAGLKGKVYLDARGIHKNEDGFFQYDQDLRDLATRLEVRTKLRIVLDDRPELFPLHSCPEAALYCGWYSLQNYIPAFTFRPGAVGYHIASFEARTLRQPRSNVWVKRLLEDGICATLGPVEEPYLDSFPLPSEFFGLLLTGKYTLAEVFFRTIRYNSWRMILIGDPLYRPFAANPVLSEKDVELKPLNLLLLD